MIMDINDVEWIHFKVFVEEKWWVEVQREANRDSKIIKETWTVPKANAKIRQDAMTTWYGKHTKT